MSKTTIDRRLMPVDGTVDPEVLAYRQRFDGKSPLGEFVREGARRMLQVVIDAEVEGFIAQAYTIGSRNLTKGRLSIICPGPTEVGST